MKKLKRSQKRWILAASLLGAAIIILIIAAVAMRTTPIHPAPGNSTSSEVAVVGSSTTAKSSTEETVDTNISLAPSGTPLAIPVPSETAPSVSPVQPPSYVGCKLDLTFQIIGGNLNSAGKMQYKLESKNLGSAACTSPSISVYYANDESYASSNPPATADGYYWKMSDLAPGAESDITLAANRSAPLPAGAVVDEACLSADNGADSCADASTNAPAPQIALPAQTAIIAPTSFSAPTGKEFGVWVWTPVDEMSSTQMEQVVNEAATNHFTAIYLTIDDYLDITNLPEGAAKQQALSAYNQSLESFIGLANQKGIAVDAESGWRDWAEAGNTTNAIRVMTFVAAFNESHAQKFRGVQYDIEPYLLPQYQNDQSSVLTDYADLIENIVDQDKTDNIPLTIIVPDFYTATQQWTPEITVDGITAYTYDHIVRLLNELSGSRIIVMAYRNSTSGSNGSIALSQPEVQAADNTNVKILIAQETGPVTPSYVTFNGLSRSALFTAASTIDQAFAADKSFDGIAIDYLDPFLTLQ